MNIGRDGNMEGKMHAAVTKIEIKILVKSVLIDGTRKI